MTDYTMLLLSSFAGSISVCFAVVMIFSDGMANINGVGEGWIEVLIAGGLSVAGIRKVIA